MEFIEFKKLFQQNFADMVKDADTLFEVEIDKDEFWNLYLDSFPAGTNEIYRERREFDCSCCRHFVKAIGNAVTIKNNKIRTMWEFNTGDATWQTVIDALDAYLKAKAVTNMYVSKFNSVGTNRNHETVDGGKVVTWDHFYLDLPKKFVDTSSRSIGDIQGSAPPGYVCVGVCGYHEKAREVQYPCRGCVYYAACGSSMRTQHCDGRKTKSELRKEKICDA